MFSCQVFLVGFFSCILCAVADYTSLSMDTLWVDDFSVDSYGWSPDDIYDGENGYIHGFWATNDASVLTRTFILPEKSYSYDIIVNFSMLAGSSWDYDDYISYEISLDDGSTVLASGTTTSISGYYGSSAEGWVTTSNPYSSISSTSDWFGTYAVSEDIIFDSNQYTSENLVLEYYYSGSHGQAIDDEFWGIDSVSIRLESGLRAERAVCNDDDRSFSKSATLTPNNSISDGFASANLINDTCDNNYISGDRWICKMPETANSMCIYLSINDTCDCQSIITISVTAQRILGDVDLFSIFSFTNYLEYDSYFSILNDWHNSVTVGDETGGVFMAPYCGTEFFEIDSIFNLLDDATNDDDLPYLTSDGDISNYELLTNTLAVDENPDTITFTIVNDRELNISSIYFSSDTITVPVGCAALGNEFEYGKEIIVNFFSDQAESITAFHEFNVDLECNVPTTAPTVIPTASPNHDIIDCRDSEACCGNDDNLRANDVYCRAYRACQNSSIYVSNGCYCTGDKGCDNAYIKGNDNDNDDNSNIYCRGNKGCRNSEIDCTYGKTECSGKLSCIFSDITTNEFDCSGDVSCNGTRIDAVSGICSGDYGCDRSSISCSDNLVINGYRSCQRSTISNTPIIYVSGDDSLYYSEIYSYGVSTLDIYSSGVNSLNGAGLYCDSGSECSVYCDGSSACDGLIYYCNSNGATCNLDCDSTCNECPSIQYVTDFEHIEKQQMSIVSSSSNVNSYKNNNINIIYSLLFVSIVAGFVVFYQININKNKNKNNKTPYKYQLIPDIIKTKSLNYNSI